MVLLLLVTFILGYLLITLEHAIHINKAAIALITAVFCWTILVMNPANKDAALNAIGHQNLAPKVVNCFFFGTISDFLTMNFKSYFNL